MAAVLPVLGQSSASVTLLQAVCVSISKRQVMRLLIDQQDDFLSETKEVLRAGFLCDAVVVSDDAGQLDVGQHALCWIHAERLVPKLEPVTDNQRRAQQHVRGLIWWFYADLKAYRMDPTSRRSRELRARFDRIFRRHTGFATLDRLLKRLHANKAELLMVLDHPDIPLHTKGSENDIRCQVTKRAVSSGTHTDTGRDCRDAFLGLAKTCRKVGVAFWDYLGARIGVASAPAMAPLSDLIRSRVQPAGAG